MFNLTTVTYFFMSEYLEQPPPKKNPMYLYNKHKHKKKKHIVNRCLKLFSITKTIKLLPKLQVTKIHI